MLMRILITGATGFIGSHALRYFAEKGHETIAWSRTELPPIGLTKFGEYRSVDLLAEIPRLKVDACIHCAGLASDEGDWKSFLDGNVTTTENLFRSIDCQRWINISSCSMYPIQNGSISESSLNVNCIPSLYGKSKYLAEKFLSNNIRNGQCIISLRPRAVYGKNDRVLLPRILKLGRRGKIRLPNYGKVKISMTNIANLMVAIELCIFSNTNGYHAFNVADGQTYNLNDVIVQINERYYDKSMQLKSVSPLLLKNMIRLTSIFKKPIPMSMQAFDYITHNAIIDISKIENTLKYEPKRNFFNDLPMITEWAKSVPEQKIMMAHKSLSWLNYC